MEYFCGSKYPMVPSSGHGGDKGKTEYKLVKINTNDIQYIEGMQNYVAIHTSTGKIISLQNIKKMEEQLPGSQFIRVHKSYMSP